MVHAIVKLSIVVGLVLTVHLLNLGCKFDDPLVDHHVLDVVPEVKVLVDVRPRRVEGSEDHTFCRHILNHRVLSGVERHVFSEGICLNDFSSIVLVAFHIVVSELLVHLFFLLISEYADYSAIF